MAVFPEPETVPTVALPLAMLSTVQVTVVVADPVTEAVKAAVAPALRVVVLGLRETLTGGTGGVWTVMVALADLVASAVLVAVRVWVPAAAGAV